MGRIGSGLALAGEFGGRHPLQCPVGTRLMIVLAPGLDFALGVLERQEPMRVEAFLTQAPVERLVRRVISWLAGT